VLLAMAMLALAACGTSGSSQAGDTLPTTTLKPLADTTGPMRVLVTNDDGFDAPGIDALVQGLRTMTGVQVTVVAPATNQSGTGGRKSGGQLTATDVKTKSGYPAKAVNGFPADTIQWAVDQHGLSFRPDVVVAGVNFGQNIGPLVNQSGTVGAARAAASRGIPALAVSAGLPPAGVAAPDYAQAVTETEAWLTKYRSEILSERSTPDGSGAAGSGPMVLQNLNVPTCAPGTTQRGLINVPVDLGAASNTLNSANCASTATNPSTDVQAFDEGFEPLSNLSLS
jgi:5'-nucleotidase